MPDSSYTPFRSFGWLSASSLLVAALLSLPVLVIVAYVFIGSSDVWQHLYNTLLGTYVTNSLWLVLGTGMGVLVLGVPTAWLTSQFDFPLRRFLSIALLLPLAFPAYIIAYTYTGLLDVGGSVQTLLRELTGWQYGDYWFFNVRSLGGAVVMLSLVLYPYVYLLARSAFLEQGEQLQQASRLLGKTPWQTFWRVNLPMARPAIVAGTTLALMETLADFGTVQYFGVSTFTTGIYRSFYGLGETAAAAHLSAVLLGFVVLLILLERYSRRRLRYHTNESRQKHRHRLAGKQAWLASLVCALPFTLGFLIPALQLLAWVLTEAEIDSDFGLLAWHSFYLAVTASLVAVSLALLLGYSQRAAKRTAGRKHRLTRGIVSSATLGYALPGTIVAIGVLIPLSWLDHRLIEAAYEWFGVDLGLVLSGTLVALVFAYTVRFLAVSFGAVDSGLQKIPPSIDHAARLSGCKPAGVLRRVHLPLLRGSVLTALLIVFVDVLKELPATLILRPFDFNTLAVRAYELASDERLIDAAPASLLIVLTGLLPVVLLSRSIEAKPQGNRQNLFNEENAIAPAP